MIDYDMLFDLKCKKKWHRHFYATLNKDIIMHVWDGVDSFSYYTCPAGTRVRIWMVSRLGDVGITEKNPLGYDARVNCDVLDNLEDCSVEQINNKGA